MYRCKNCGNLFEEGEQATWHESYGEKFCGCPLCKGDFEEVKPCKLCNGYYSEESNMYNGICRNCIEERFTIQIGKKYIEQKQFEEEFYIEWCLDSKATRTSLELLDLCVSAFDGSSNALQVIKDFCFDDFSNFAEWYSMEVKNGKI